MCYSVIIMTASPHPYDRKNSHPNKPTACATTAAASGLPPQLSSRTELRSHSLAMGLAHMSATAL